MPEHTIAENLTRLTTARTNIANAIAAKGGTVTSGDGFEEFPADIATIPSGGGESAERNGVNFYDYDGTIVDSYSASDFAALSALPDNPAHEGLTAQGWNWSLADAKAYVAKYGRLDIGQMYITDDGALRLYIHLEEGRLSPVLGLCPNGTLTVDWGDGSATETMTGSSTSTLVYLGHTYAAGDYVISVLPSSGSALGFGQRNSSSTVLCKSQTDDVNGRRVYLNAIQKVEIPDGVTSIGSSAFNNCYSLASVTIPDGVTSIGGYAFANCTSLASVTIPDGVTSIGGYAFQYCYSLASVTIPDGVTSIGSSAFNGCYSLASVTIPDGVTSIGGSAFNNCYSLASVTIPDGVTSIGSSAFNNCYSLASVTIPDGVTSISSSAFMYCYSLASVTIPDGVTSISSSAFNNCRSLASVTIPDGVTSIGADAFDNCTSLASVTIPDGVTSIGGYAFNICYGLGFIKFASATPPTVSSSTAWGSTPKDCIIYVPAGYLEDYEGATNYPDPDVYTYVEY
jgi:hypothetical protein